MSAPSDNYVTHVIFDFGGTLLDYEQLFTDLLDIVANKLGIKYQLTPELVHQVRQSGRSALFLDLILGHLDIEFDGKQYEEFRIFFYRELLRIPLRLTPGVDRLIHHLNANHIPIAIATNGSHEEWNHCKKSIVDFDESLFSVVLCAADDPEVINNKPAPDIYLVCAKRFATPPESLNRCVVFEDSLVGITGAVASGMRTVLINDKRGLHFHAIANQITQINDSFNDFRPESVGLPPYQ